MDYKKMQGKLIELEILSDQSVTGRERPWREKKMANTLLAAAYDEVNRKKAVRLRECANLLLFKRNEDGTKKLHTMNSCRVRLCPICGWRRSLKIYSHTRAIMEGMSSEKQWAYLFLTLTIRNCEGAELSETLDRMTKGWMYLAKYKQFKQTVKGWYRGLEVTHNIDPASESYDTYHPHFHCVFAVNRSYFKGKGYMTKDDWTSLWVKAMKLEYQPVVDVRRVKGSTAAAVAEAAKYSVKSSDYIIPQDWDLTVDTVRILDRALADRRLVGYGGKFKDWHKRLNLDDEMDGDLVHTDAEKVLDTVPEHLISYVWCAGYSQYVRE